MTKLEKLEREISALPPQDVHALGKWLDELREQLWVIECDPIAPDGWLPTGVEQVQAKSSIIGQNEVMLRDHDGVLSAQQLPNEVRRWKATLEEFFLAVTSSA